MKRSLCICLLALTPLLAAPAGAAPAKDAAAAKEFLALVRQNFIAWDYEHKGALTRAMLETDMQKPEFKGDAASALAGLKWGMQLKEPETADEQKWVAEVTLADLDEAEKEIDAAGKVDNSVLNKAVGHFTAGRDNLAKESRALFAVGGVPHLAAIRQTWDDDCYFNSGVGAIALERPHDIARLFKPNANGSYTITFPGKPPLVVPAPTDAEIAAYTDANDGVWFNVLEKAYALLRNIKPENQTAEPLDKAAQHAGRPAEVIGLISGHAVESTPFHKQGGPALADAQLLARVRDELTAAFREHRGVATGNGGHAYVVAAYDPRTDTVTIHNPYDQNGSEALVSGDLGVTFSGYTSMSTQRFVDNFTAINVEQAK